jgi:ribosomal protein L35
MKTMPGKLRKSLLKRFKIKKKKILRKKSGISHNLAKKEKDVKRRKKELEEVDKDYLKYLNY